MFFDTHGFQFPEGFVDLAALHGDLLKHVLQSFCLLLRRFIKRCAQAFVGGNIERLLVGINHKTGFCAAGLFDIFSQGIIHRYLVGLSPFGIGGGELRGLQNRLVRGRSRFDDDVGPGISLACSQVSSPSAAPVSRSFCTLFLPTKMSTPSSETKWCGLDSGTLTGFLPLLLSRISPTRTNSWRISVNSSKVEQSSGFQLSFQIGDFFLIGGHLVDDQVAGGLELVVLLVAALRIFRGGSAGLRSSSIGRISGSK